MIQQALRPIRALRRKLRQVRYYSATRRSTRLDRIGEVAMLIMLLAGLPAAWLLDVACETPRAPASVPGLIHLGPEGSTFATAGPEDGRRGHAPGDAELAGGFTVTVTRVERGWPFATTVILGPAQLDLEMFRPRKESRRGVLLGDDPVSAEIAAVLADLGVEHGLTHRRPGAWIANTLVLSLLLPMATWIAFAVAARCAAVASHARRRARRERLAEGRCSVCGYDLRGNPYGAQCPECGNVSG